MKITLILGTILFLVLAMSAVSAYHDVFTYDHYSYYGHTYFPRAHYRYNTYSDSLFIDPDFDRIIVSPRSSRNIGRLNSPTITNYNYIYSPSYDRPIYNRYNQNYDINQDNYRYPSSNCNSNYNNYYATDCYSYPKYYQTTCPYCNDYNTVSYYRY